METTKLVIWFFLVSFGSFSFFLRELFFFLPIFFFFNTKMSQKSSDTTQRTPRGKVNNERYKKWTRTEIPSSKRNQELERDAFSLPVALDLSGRTCAMPWSLCVFLFSFFSSSSSLAIDDAKRGAFKHEH